MEDTKNHISVSYEYNNILYNVSANKDFHMKIRNDDKFAANYFQRLVTSCQVKEKSSGQVETNESEINTEQITEAATDSIAINFTDTTNANESLPTKKKQKVMQQFPDEAVTDDEAWDNAAIKFLLNEYSIRKERYRNPKIKKIILWREIEVEFKKINRTFSASELSKKFGNMKTTYSKIKKNNSKRTTGTGRKSWPWLAQMDEIFHNDLSINFTSDVIASMPTDENTEPMNLSSSPLSVSTSDASKNDTASNASTSKVMADLLYESSFEVPSNCFKSARGKRMYYHRQKQLDLDANKLEMMKTLNSKFEENKKLQEKGLTIWNERMLEVTQVLRERNEILKSIAKSLQDKSSA